MFDLILCRSWKYVLLFMHLYNKLLSRPQTYLQQHIGRIHLQIIRLSTKTARYAYFKAGVTGTHGILSMNRTTFIDIRLGATQILPSLTAPLTARSGRTPSTSLRKVRI